MNNSVKTVGDVFLRSFSSSNINGSWCNGHMSKAKTDQACSDVKNGVAKQSFRDMGGHKIAYAETDNNKVVVTNSVTTKEETKVFTSDDGKHVVVHNDELGYNGKVKEFNHSGTEFIMSKKRFLKLQVSKAKKDLVKTGTFDEKGNVFKTADEIKDLYTNSSSIMSHEFHDDGSVTSINNFEKKDV